jgi:hypothetical protein
MELWIYRIAITTTFLQVLLGFFLVILFLLAHRIKTSAFPGIILFLFIGCLDFLRSWQIIFDQSFLQDAVNYLWYGLRVGFIGWFFWHFLAYAWKYIKKIHAKISHD